MAAIGLTGAAAAGVIVLLDRADSTAKANANARAAAVSGPKAVMVTVDPATTRAIQRRVQVVGSLWGRDEVRITPKVEGRVMKIHHFVGDVVHPGDVLMEIDERNYQLAVNEAKRALELELTKLNLTALPSADFDIDKLPSVAKAVAQEKLAIGNRERMRRLAGPARTEEEHDKAESEALVAVATSRQMRLEAETALAQVRHKLALLETAQQRLADAKVVVPTPSESSGQLRSLAATNYLVSQRNVSEGETVGTLVSGTPVFRLVIADPLKMLSTIPERNIAEVKVGQAVEIQVEAYPGETFPAVVARANPTVDRLSRTFQAEILIRNSQGKLHAGSFAKAAILTRIDDKALTIPDEALVAFAGVTKVFVMRGDKVVDVPVTTDVRLEDNSSGRRRFWVEVHGNLQAGEQIVTSGQSQLADGASAKIRPTGQRPDVQGQKSDR
jgi:RND family efflux transporter MFP subunit